jgi:hypothetical protein
MQQVADWLEKLGLGAMRAAKQMRLASTLLRLDRLPDLTT